MKEDQWDMDKCGVLFCVSVAMISALNGSQSHVMLLQYLLSFFLQFDLGPVFPQQINLSLI